MVGGVNDIQIFGALLSRFCSGTAGWFAVGCRPRLQVLGAPGAADLRFAQTHTLVEDAVPARYPASSPAPRWLLDASPYDAHSYQYCASESASNPSVSPFNALEYVTHLKNHSGPIQHDMGT